MSTHFLIEGADKGSYRGLRSIKGELRSCLLHSCCLLLLTASVWRRWKLQGKGPRVLLGSSQRMLGRQSLHELLFEALLQNNCSESLSSLLSSMLMCLKGKFRFIFLFSSFFPSVLCSSFSDICGAVMLGLCPKWDHHSRSLSVSTWKHKGTSCTMLVEVHQR